jgi:hypothetical protein
MSAEEVQVVKTPVLPLVFTGGVCLAMGFLLACFVQSPGPASGSSAAAALHAEHEPTKVAAGPFVARSLQVDSAGVKQDVLVMLRESSIGTKEMAAASALTASQVQYDSGGRGRSSTFTVTWSTNGVGFKSQFTPRDVADDMTRRLEASGTIPLRSKDVSSSINGYGSESGSYTVWWSQPLVATPPQPAATVAADQSDIHAADPAAQITSKVQ